MPLIRSVSDTIFLHCFLFRNRLRTVADHLANLRGPQFEENVVNSKKQKTIASGKMALLFKNKRALKPYCIFIEGDENVRYPIVYTGSEKTINIILPTTFQHIYLYAIRVSAIKWPSSAVVKSLLYGSLFGKTTCVIIQ
jgi:hypothetical protein